MSANDGKNAGGGRKKGKTDTMPHPGKVGQVCQKWLVHEDEALAYRLQNEESEYLGSFLAFM